MISANILILTLLHLISIVRAADSIINTRVDGEVGKKNYGRYSSAAVASENPVCSRIGKETMTKGGNAVDSAIATLLCIGVINNFSSGIGGGGFMLVRRGTGESRVFDFREVAPSTAHQDMFKDDPNKAKLGGLAVAIPGEIRGFRAAHNSFGQLPWAELFTPSIALARNGFEVTKKLEVMIKKFQDELRKSPGMRETYFDADGSPKLVGSKVHRPALARTLEAIARDGDEVFYSGYIADALIAEINRNGGSVSKSDFTNYQVKEKAPVEGNYRDFRVISVGAPASGSSLIEALQILNGVNLSISNLTDATSSAHAVVEAMKFAYASRMKLADPDFVDIASNLRKMLSQEYADNLRKTKLSMKETFEPKHYFDSPSDAEIVHDSGTTHVTVLDAQDMAVSATCTVNLEFGSKLMDSETGIILNNEMDDFSIPGIPNQFSIPASESNFIRPGKRPVSSSTPVILVRNGRVEIIAGGTGGSRIISSTLFVLLGMIDFHQNPIYAVAAPRFHHQLVPNYLICEHEVNPEVLEGLRSKGHSVHVLDQDLYYSSVQAIRKDLVSGKIIAAADPRKGGSSDGF